MKVIQSVSGLAQKPSDKDHILLVWELKHNSRSVPRDRRDKPFMLIGLPGGKVGPDQTPEDAVKAEMREEAGVEAVAIGDVLYKITKTDPVNRFQLETTVYACTLSDEQQLFLPNDPDGAAVEAMMVNKSDVITMTRTQQDISRNEPLRAYLENGITNVHYQYEFDPQGRLYLAGVQPLDIK